MPNTNTHIVALSSLHFPIDLVEVQLQTASFKTVSNLSERIIVSWLEMDDFRTYPKYPIGGFLLVSCKVSCGSPRWWACSFLGIFRLKIGTPNSFYQHAPILKTQEHILFHYLATNANAFYLSLFSNGNNLASIFAYDTSFGTTKIPSTTETGSIP